MNERIARLYVQGECVKAKLIRKDTDTYIAVLLIMVLLEGRFKGDEIAVFEHGDKFQEWIN